MKPLVVTSIEDDTGDRCVDIVQMGKGAFAFRECRRDPEDNHGWRHLSAAPPEIFPSATTAEAAARAHVGWLTDNAG